MSMNQLIWRIRMLAKGHFRTRSTLLLVAAVAAVALGACNNTSTGPAGPGGVVAVSGSGQFADVGAPAANPLVAFVIDQNGQPLSGASVRWVVTGGGGAVSDTVSTSDANGHASTTYTAGSTPGTATIVAVAEQLWTANFTIHVVTP